jgi:hypothetical protein
MTTTQRDLLDYVNTTAMQYDAIRHQIYDAYELFRMEIEDECASVANEAELCISEIQELISEYETNTTTNR